MIKNKGLQVSKINDEDILKEAKRKLTKEEKKYMKAFDKEYNIKEE